MGPTGDSFEAWAALLGTDAPNLTPGSISRLTTGWQEAHHWKRRDLSGRHPRQQEESFTKLGLWLF